MTNETEQHIDEMRKKLDTVLDKFTIEDFKRVHAKFVGAVISVEVGFKKRFPEESDKYMKEFYGEDA